MALVRTDADPQHVGPALSVAHSNHPTWQRCALQAQVERELGYLGNCGERQHLSVGS